MHSFGVWYFYLYVLRGQKMKRMITISALAFVALLAVTASGCASPKVKNRVKYKYPTELMPSEHAYVKTCDI